MAADIDLLALGCTPTAAETRVMYGRVTAAACLSVSGVLAAAETAISSEQRGEGTRGGHGSSSSNNNNSKTTTTTATPINLRT